MSTLFVMCGLPGSGKSTFLKNISKTYPNVEVISRDEIRFSLTKEDEQYFAHEDAVRKTLYDKINLALSKGKDVFVDQTSLNPGSRRLLLTSIHGYTACKAIVMDIGIKTCLERNKMRAGTRAYVPEYIIYNMAKSFRKPSIQEGFSNIFTIKEGEKFNNDLLFI